MPSIQHQLIGLFLRATGAKKGLSSADVVRESVEGPPPGIAAPEPPDKMRRKHVVTEARITADDGTDWPVFTIEPREAPAEQTVIFLNGGAYIRDPIAQHWSLIGQLVEQAHARVIVPMYRLAPLGTAESGVGTTARIIESAIGDYGADNVVVAGDSAGGGLALAATQVLRDQDRPLPSRLVLLAPWCDVTVESPDQPAIEPHDPMLAIPGLREAGKMWAGDLPLTDPRVSPLYGDMRGLPPITVFAGTYDLLVPDSRRLVADARAAGTVAEYYEGDRLFHDYPIFPCPEGAKARARMVEICSPQI